ncbi:MAG: omptin family outer membrane protease [Rhizomicrobium sp.]
MRKGNVRAAAVVLCVLSVQAMAPAQAASPPDNETSWINWNWTRHIVFQAGIGHMSGSANELSYDPTTHRILSELHWQVNDAAVLKGKADIGITDWLSAGISGWTAIASDNVMDDYDWNLAPYNQWSDHSHHPDTQLPTAWQGAIDLQARIYHHDGVSLSAIGGYQWTHFKWAAYGGSYTYSVQGFRDVSGSFPANQLDSTYAQSFSAAFLGISGSYALDNRWQLGAELKGSPWAITASDQDHHVLRQLIYWDKFGQSHLWSIRGAVSYRIDAHVWIVGSLKYQAYTLGKGPTLVLDQSTGTTTQFTGAASGTQNQMLTLYAGLRYAI